MISHVPRAPLHNVILGGRYEAKVSRQDVILYIRQIIRGFSGLDGGTWNEEVCLRAAAGCVD